MLDHLLDRKVAPKEAQKMCSKGTAVIVWINNRLPVL